MPKFQTFLLATALFAGLTVTTSCSDSPEAEVNTPPTISGFSFDKDPIYTSDTILVSTNVSDDQGDDLQFQWSVSVGTFEQVTETSIRWYTAQDVSEAKLELRVMDSQNTTELSQDIQLGAKPLELWWESIGNVPNEMDILWRSMAFVIDDFAYIGTGRTNDNSARTNEFWKYDIKNNEWSSLAPHPGPFTSSLTTFTIGSKGYTISFCCDSQGETFYEYDIITNVWTEKDNFPGTHFLGASSFVIGNKAYVIDQNNANWAYDATLDEWSQKADFPGLASQRSIQFATDTKGFVGEENSNNLYSYDPQLDSWSAVASYPLDRMAGQKTFVLKGAIIVGYGYEVGSETSSKKSWIYNAQTDTWKEGPLLPISGRRVDPTIFVYDDRGYFLHGNTHNNDIWRLNKNQ